MNYNTNGFQYKAFVCRITIQKCCINTGKEREKNGSTKHTPTQHYEDCFPCSGLTVPHWSSLFVQCPYRTNTLSKGSKHKPQSTFNTGNKLSIPLSKSVSKYKQATSSPVKYFYCCLLSLPPHSCLCLSLTRKNLIRQWIRVNHFNGSPMTTGTWPRQRDDSSP